MARLNAGARLPKKRPRLLVQGFDCRLGSRVDAEFLKDVFHVAVDGPNADAQCIGDFGHQEPEARDALRVFQFYRFTEQGRIGNSAKSFSYYLVNGQAPRGVRFGVHSIPFRPERLGVRQVNGQWMICEAEKQIMRAGDNQEEARQALQAIQRYQFDNLCRLGGLGDGTLTFFVRER